MIALGSTLEYFKDFSLNKLDNFILIELLIG